MSALPAMAERALPSADPAEGTAGCAVVQFGHGVALPLRGVPEEALQVAHERSRFGKEVDALRKRGLTLGAAVDEVRTARWGEFPRLSCGGHGGASLLTVANYKSWVKMVRDGATGAPRWEMVAELVDGYRRGQRASAAEGVYMKRIMKYVLCGNHIGVGPAVVRVRAEVVGELGFVPDGFPSERQARHYFATKVSTVLRMKAKLGAGEYRDKCTPWVLRDWSGIEPGEVAFLDHRIMDMWVKVPDPERADGWLAVRPYITAYEDARSGYFVNILLYADRYPNGDRIMECIAGAVQKAGRVPDFLYTDQGNDFLAQGLLSPARFTNERGKAFEHSVSAQLGAGVETAAGYNGKEKPIEGSFGVMARDFERFMPGYWGNRPSHRPEHAEEFRGNPEMLLSVQEMTDALNAFLVEVFHQTGSRSRRTGGETRAAVWERRRMPETPLNPAWLFQAMLRPDPKDRLVDRGPGQVCGFAVRYGKWWYGSLSLRGHFKRKIMVKRFFQEPSFEYAGKMLPVRLYAFDLDGTFIDVIEAVEGVPALARTPDEREKMRLAAINMARARKATRVEFLAVTGHERAVPPRSYMLAGGSVPALPPSSSAAGNGAVVGNPAGEASTGRRKRLLKRDSDGAEGPSPSRPGPAEEYLPEALRDVELTPERARIMTKAARRPGDDIREMLGIGA
jgi:hypothetical protein